MVQIYVHSLLWISLQVFIGLTTGKRYICPGGVEYVAQKITHGQRKDFLFYGVQQNVSSVSKCAQFCYETEFCRSAAFDPKDKTCELAYAGFIKCQQEDAAANRIKGEFNTEEITSVFCIRCPDGKIVDEQLNSIGDGNTNFASDAGNTTEKSPLEERARNDGTCFVEFEQRALLRSAYSVIRDVSLNECKCKCAQTWTLTFAVSSQARNRCQSFQYFFDRNECVLNSIKRLSNDNSSRNHNGHLLVALTAQRSSYYEFLCQNDLSMIEQLASSSLCRKFAETSTSVSGGSQNDTCFDQADGYILNGLAGTLEHGVTVEECKCLCANSVQSGSYDFNCKSVMYYHGEKDCVLNLDNRLNRPDMFRKDDTKKNRYVVSYIGLTCDGEQGRQQYDSECKQYTRPFGVRGTTPISIIAATVAIKTDSKSKEKEQFSVDTTKKQPPPGEKTDACFLEIPNYILSGMASSIETGITLEQCKCLCADSNRRYNFDCLSIQYYADVKTCLLSRKNRIQEPRNFKKVVSSAPHTYLDYLCSENGGKRDNYWKNSCSPLTLPAIPENHDNEKTSVNSTVTAGGSSTLQTKTTTTSAFKNFEEKQPIRNTPPNRGSPDLATPNPASPVVASTLAGFSGPCRYSAFYESEFNGRRMIERIVVGDPLACFQSCAQKHCKSANILNFLGRFKYCETFLDSGVDYPNTNMITYNAASVYFEGVECQRV